MTGTNKRQQKLRALYQGC